MQVGMSAPPFGRTLGYITNDMMPNLRPDITQAVEARHRNAIDEEVYLDTMKKQGAGRDLSMLLLDIARPLLNAGELITLYRRGHVGEKPFRRDMEKLGYTSVDIGRLLTLTQFYPQPADLIRFAVREVYSPDVRRQYGMDEDFPPEFLEASAKAGMTPEQAQNYWASHWELPSINMGFEMLHRRVITQEDMSTLLRTQDVMPFWREKITQISYSPFTRVDIRRMYRDKVLSEEQVYESYQDIGYDEWHAEKLTEWTVQSVLGTEKDLTRTMILEGYEEGQLTREEAIAYFIRMRYDEKEADFILTLKDNDVAEKLQKEQIQTYQAMYRAGTSTTSEFKAQLDGLNLRAAYRDKIFYSTVRERNRRITLPSRQDIDLWFTRGVIDFPGYVKKMKQIGYVDEDIQAYVQTMNKLPNTQDLGFWLQADIIDIPTWERYMGAIGYAEEEIARYLQGLV